MSEKATYEVGKGKPPRNRRFGQPEGNPNGKTSEQKRAEMKAGEIAAQIQLRMLEALSKTILADDAAALRAIASDPLRLIKDAMDREYGTAVQKVEAKGGFTVTIASDDANL